MFSVTSLEAIANPTNRTTVGAEIIVDDPEILKRDNYSLQYSSSNNSWTLNSTSLDSPIENEDLCSARLFRNSSVERKTSRIASVEINLAKLLLAPIFIATVDLPVAVAPAIMSNLGGRLVMAFAVASAIPTFRAMAILGRAVDYTCHVKNINSAN